MMALTSRLAKPISELGKTARLTKGEPEKGMMRAVYRARSHRDPKSNTIHDVRIEHPRRRNLHDSIRGVHTPFKSSPLLKAKICLLSLSTIVRSPRRPLQS